MVPVLTFMMALPFGYEPKFKYIYTILIFFGSKLPNLMQDNRVLYPFISYRLETVKIKCNSGRAKILGSLVCIGGVLMLTLYKGKPLFNFSHYESAASMVKSSAANAYSTKTTERWTIGVIAMVIGTMFWSSWYILQSKISKSYPCQYSSTAIMSFFGALQSAVICLCTDHNLSIWVLKGKIQIIAFLYSVSSLFQVMT